MSVRKMAALLAAAGLAVGLIGGGVGAVFHDSVTAHQDISVGEFSCVISDGGGGLLGDYDAYGAHSVTYAPYTINSSAAGTDPLAFTVLNAGSIPARLTVTSPTVMNPPFSIIGDPFATVDLAPSGTHVYNTGVKWTELDNSNLAQTGSLTWTVNCGEVPATPATQTVIGGLNNGANPFNFNGAGGWAGWSCPAGTHIVSASVATNPDGTGTALYSISSVTLWKTGATVTSAYSPFTVTNFPNTPWGGYTYGASEEGAIVQNDGTAQSLYIVLQCTQP